MTTKAQQTKNFLWYLLPVIISNALPFLTLPIFTRILTTKEYGAWALAQVFGSFLSGIANFGLTICYERNFFEYRERKKSAELFYSNLLFVFMALFLGAIFTYIFKASLAKWIIGSPNHAGLLFLSYCSNGAMYLIMFYSIYLKNSENAKLLVTYTISESVLATIVSIFCVAYLKIGVIGLVWGQLISCFIILFMLEIKFFKILPISFNLLILKDSLKLSYPLTPSILFKVVGNQFDKYMIGLLASIGGVGIYTIGQKFAYVVFSFSTALENVFLPQTYIRMFDDKEKGGESVGKYLTPFVYISIAIAVLTALFSEEIITILTPKPYHGAIAIVLILSMMYGSYFFGKMPQLLYAKKTYISSFITIIRIIITVAINIPFILKWGAVGAAWATFLAGLITGLIHFIISQHYYKINWEYNKIGLVFLIFFGSSFLLILCRAIMVDYPIRLILKFIFLTAYVYLGIKIGVITSNNFNLIKNAIRNKSIAAFQNQ